MINSVNNIHADVNNINNENPKTPINKTCNSDGKEKKNNNFFQNK